MKNVIYAIRHIESGRMYVGSALSFNKRRRLHLWALRRGTHHSIKLQRAWNKYGEDAFVFEVVEPVADSASLISREQHWIDTMSAVKTGYNIRPTAGSALGTRHSAETKARMSLLKTGLRASAETRAKISASKKGVPFPPEKGRKHSALMTGRKLTPKQCEQRANTLRTDEVRAKISASCKGYVKSDEHMEKIRQALARPDVKAKLKARRPPNQGKTQSPEMKEHLRQKAIERWQDPELRAKFVAARRARTEKA